MTFSTRVGAAMLLLGLGTALSSAFGQTDTPRISRAQAGGTITASVIDPIVISPNRFVLNPDGTGTYYRSIIRSDLNGNLEGFPMRWQYRRGQILVVLDVPLITRFRAFLSSAECGREVQGDLRFTQRTFLLSGANGPESLKTNGSISTTIRRTTSSREACYVPTDETLSDSFTVTLGFDRSRPHYSIEQLAGRRFQFPVPGTAAGSVGRTGTALLSFSEGGTGSVGDTGQTFRWRVSDDGGLDITFADGSEVNYLRTTALLNSREYDVNGLVTMPGQVEKGVINGQEILASPRPFRRSDAPAEFHQVNVGSDYPNANPDPDSGFYFVLREGGEGDVVSNGVPAPLHDWFIDGDGRLVIDRTGGPFQGCEPGVDEGCFISNRRAWTLVRLSNDRYYVIEEIRFNGDPSIPIESVAPDVRNMWYTRRPLGSSRP